MGIHERQPVPTVPPPLDPPPGVGGPPPARRKVLRVELAVMAFLAVLPSLVISLEGITDPTSIDIEIGVIELVATLLASCGPAAVAVYLLWRDGRLAASGFARRPLSFVAGYGALGWVSCLIALTTVGLVVGIVLTATGQEADSTSDLEFELTAGTFVAALAVSLTAGIAEEIVFRAYAISRMEEAGYVRAAIWAPWLLFTLVHLYQGPLALLGIGSVAAVFVWLFRWKRSVWPVMVAHAAYDLFVLMVAAALS